MRKWDVGAPGSDEALAKGCRCPVLDNAHGLGYMGVAGSWVISSLCPLHAEEEEEDGEHTIR